MHLILEIARATDHLRAEQEKGTDSPFYNELLGREFGMAGRAHERGTTILAAARSMLEHPDHGPKVKIIEDKKRGGGLRIQKMDIKRATQALQYACMHVHMQSSMHACTHRHTHDRTAARTHARKHARTHARTHTGRTS